jgi:hypothetical protein
MQRLKAFFILLLIVANSTVLLAQKAASIATDLTLLRNFSENAGFTAFGQTVRVQVHFNQKESGYAWINYYINGKYKNDFTALPYDPLINSAIQYTSSSKVGFRQLSIGWQHFFRGGFDGDTWSIYSLAGFGLLTGKVENTYNPVIDTSKYFVPKKAIEGTGTFRRLTLDLGLGAETQIASGFFLYGEARTWIPASRYPSPYLYNNNIPRVGILSGGVRILFDY